MKVDIKKSTNPEKKLMAIFYDEDSKRKIKRAKKRNRVCMTLMAGCLALSLTSPLPSYIPVYMR